jgi:hypothetical protein
VLHQELELGIALWPGQSLGLGDEPGQRGVVGAGGGLDVIVREGVTAPSKTPIQQARRSSSDFSNPARVRSASTAAAGLEAAQRISASVPQKFSRWRRSSAPAASTTAAQ